MATVVLNAKSREKKGTKTECAKNGDFIPGIVYGGNEEPEAVCIAKDILNKYVYKSTFLSTVFELNGVGKKGQKYIAKEAQFHPVTDQVLHVDLMRVDDNSKIKLQVPLAFTHEEAAPALKLGGVLNILNRKVTVLCAPDHIPEQIEVDLTGLQFHHTINAFGLKLPEGVSLPNHVKNYTIATVVAPSSMKKEEKAAATAAPAASEAAAS